MNEREYGCHADIADSSELLSNSLTHLERPDVMNLELTGRCPLHCPQCYCDPDNGRDMPLDVALSRIEEAGRIGMTRVQLSGGETLVYPHLCEVIRAAADAGLRANIAISGWGFSQEVFDKLIAAGVAGIFVSLNGSTEEINKKTRDGYSLSCDALALLQKNGFPTTVNWVMHRSNACDLPDMLRLCERYAVDAIVVMRRKPDSKHSLSDCPTMEQMETVAQIVQTYDGNTRLLVETCYSQMLALVGRRFFMNLNRGILRGCGAGRTMLSVTAEGKLTPCRHLLYGEEWASMSDYWEKSPVLSQIRRLKTEDEPGCGQCALCAACRPCLAENASCTQDWRTPALPARGTAGNKRLSGNCRCGRH